MLACRIWYVISFGNPQALVDGFFFNVFISVLVSLLLLNSFMFLKMK